MPISKQTIREIAVKAPGGISRVSQESADLLNGIADRVLSVVFPKDASVVLQNVLQRVSSIAEQNTLISRVMDITLRNAVKEDFPIPHDTVRRLIREHAGDVKVPEDTIRVISHMLEILLAQIINVCAGQIMPAGLDRKLEGKHIVELISKDISLNLPPIGPLNKVGARKSKSKKRSSKRSKKSLRRRSRK